MNLKNYTTSIKVEKTMAEIEQILVKSGASHIFKMYNKDGNPIALAFKCLVQEQELSFKLPMEEDKILQIFDIAVADGHIPRKYKGDQEQAKRTGWRIIKDWVASQMAMIEINLVSIEEVFLPYMYDEINNETLYQKLKQTNFNIQLENKKDN